MIREFGRAGRLELRALSRPATVALLAAAMHLVLAWAMRTPGLGWGEDDAAFLLLSQDLQTLNYRETQDILAPVHARFPPGFPAMLAVVGGLFGNRLDVLLAFVGLCSAASVLFLFDGARRAVGAETAAIVSTLYALNPSSLAGAGSLLSETPFRLLMLVALWAALRESEGTRYAVVAGAATILAALTRTAGVVFLPALAIYWLIKRRNTWVLGLAVASLPMAAWLGFTFAAPEAVDRRLYIADIKAGADTYTGALATRLQSLIPRIKSLLTDTVPTALSFATVSGTIVDNLIWLGCLVTFGITGVVALFRRWAVAAAFLVAYGLLVMLWRWTFDRLIYPVVPLLLLAMLTGVSVLAQRFAPGTRRWFVYGLAALIAVGALRADGRMLATAWACNRATPADSPDCWPTPDREYIKLAHWVRDSTPVDALFFVSKERAFFHHSGRKTINQDRGLRENSESIADYLRSRGVGYTAVTPIGVHRRRHNSLIVEACRDFAIVRAFSSQTLLLRVRSAGEASDTTLACRVLRDSRES